MVSAYKDFWKRTFDFTGKSSRGDYWFAFLVQTLIYTVLFIAASALPDGHPLTVVVSILFLGLLIASVVPTVSLTVRRIRDAGLPPLFVLFWFIPLVGALIVMIFAMLPTKESYDIGYPQRQVG